MTMQNISCDDVAVPGDIRTSRSTDATANIMITTGESNVWLSLYNDGSVQLELDQFTPTYDVWRPDAAGR